MGIIGQIKALLKLRKEVNKMKLTEIKTSEGRMTLLLNIVGVYSAVQGFIPPALAAKIAVGSVAAYSIARAIVKLGEAIAKMTPSAKDDAIVAEAGALLDRVVPTAPPPAATTKP